MTPEGSLHLQVRPLLVPYLKAARHPFWEPALTDCPHCGSNAGILLDYRWECRNCGNNGDVVDYVMIGQHFASKMDAIKHICRVLNIKITKLDAIRANELMDKELPVPIMLVDQLLGPGVYILAGAPKIGKSWLVLSLP